ncbi:unnamed protein product [Owenia fusiformis]|uniref:Uncharacterized protein n=1 Tax=Owenia fusiformis TaxID=6347 RepID=A0A8J1UC85_OWEFU|nr:unnamed protein product [Owenia fusiformis]
MKMGHGHVMLTLVFGLGLATLSTALDLNDFDQAELDAVVVPGIPPVTGGSCFKYTYRNSLLFNYCGLNLAFMVNIRKGLWKEHGNGIYLYSMIEEFIEKIARRMDIGIQASKNLVGVVVYFKFPRKEFGLKMFTDIDTLINNGIRKIDFANGGERSYPFKAMSYIYSNESFFSYGNRYEPRLRNRNAVIVLDDGILKVSNNARRIKLKTQSDKLKGISTVFVIGLRNQTLDLDAYDNGGLDIKDRIRIDNWITMSAPLGSMENPEVRRENIITTSLWSYKDYLLDSLVDKVMERLNEISTCEYLTGEDPGECV